MRENKLVVLGAGGVGKTSLVIQYLEGSFSNTYKPTVEDYYRHTVQLPGSPVPMILVGNKSDIKDGRRQVPQEMGEEAATQEMGGCPYIETSAKYNINVSQLFQELLQQARAMELQRNNPLGTPEAHKRRRMSRRLSSLGSSIPLLNVRRKSSEAKNNDLSTSDKKHHSVDMGDPRCVLL